MSDHFRCFSAREFCFRSVEMKAVHSLHFLFKGVLMRNIPTYASTT